MTENFKTVALAIVLLLTTSNIFASEVRPTVKIINGADKVFALIVNDTKLTQLSIKLSDVEGIVLLNEEVEVSNKVSKSYDLTSLPEGTYEVSLESAVAIQTQFLKVSKNSLEMLTEGETKIFKPTILLKNGAILFNMLSLERKEVSVAILNEDGEELFSEKIENTQAIHKSYSAAKMPKGKYTVRVETQGEVFRTALKK